MSEQEGLPRGWAWATLEELCEINPKHAGDHADTLPVSFVPMAAVDEQSGEITAAVERLYGEVRKGYTHFADGDVLWAKITPCMENGKAAVARGLTNGIGCGTTEFFVLRSRGAVLPEYLHRFMRQTSYRTAARRTMQSGVGQARVPKEFIENTRLPVPPLAEQHRIVAKLDALLVSSRVAREALDVVPTLLDQYGRSVLSAAFRGDLTADWRATRPTSEQDADTVLRKVALAREEEWRVAQARGTYQPTDDDKQGPFCLPLTWRWASLEQLTSAVASICYGVVQPGEECPGGVPLIRVCDVDGGQVLESALRTIAPHVDAEYTRSRLHGGEVLVTVVGTIGRVAVAPATVAGANIARAVARLRPVAPVAPEWIAHALMTPEAQTVLTRESREVARKTLNVGSLAQVLVPVAPADEMREILRRVTLYLVSRERQREAVISARAHVDQLEQSALAKAFRGELVAQDPIEEPASAVLARAERTAPARATRRRALARA